MRQVTLALSMAATLFAGSAIAQTGNGTLFWLDTPADGQTVFGIVETSGWVLDERGVSNIDLYLDGNYHSSADLNQPRYDVIQAYPWYAGTDSARPGFSTSFNTRTMSSGAHTLLVRVTFSDSSQEDYAQRSVFINNSLNQVPFGEIDTPGPNQPMNGVFPVEGWALDDTELRRVEVMVDGLVMGETVLGIGRPDIANRFPDIAEAATAGWLYNLDSSRLINGVHTLSARLYDETGLSRVIGHRYVQVFNNGFNLVPFGRIDWPIPNHIMYGIGCTPQGGWSGIEFAEPLSLELVSGWVLDIGSRSDNGGVKWVELLINGTLQANTLTDEFYLPHFEMDVNYFGHERLDVHRLFADIPVSKDSGYTFVLDMSDLMIVQGYHQGLHYLTVRAGDIEGNIADIARIPVIFDCDDDPDRPSWGDIITPTHMENVSDTIEIYGWAIDFDFLELVEIWVDGVFFGYADDHTPSAWLHEAFPWYPTSQAANAGYRFDFDTTQVNDGEHQLVVRTVDQFGRKTFIGQRAFVVDNLNLDKTNEDPINPDGETINSHSN